ncbi:MAG: EAL domain-containing protein [Cyanobacteria bacterium J06598_3]
MTFASGPAQETLRLAKLNDYNILDTLPEPVYDDIVELVAHICQTPSSLVSLIDANRQWFKAKVGFEAAESSRSIAFCSYTIEQSGIMVVEDTHQSERFRNNPLVTGKPYIRFYAGAPLVTPDGYALGSLCVIDYQPRQLNEGQLRALEVLSHQVVAQMELRRQAHQLKATNETLEQRVKERTSTLSVALHRLLQTQSKLMKREAASRHSALHDPLTGLANRSYFMQRLDQAVQLSCRQPSHLYAVIFIDLNNFKPMNDALGHDVGDRILCHVADQITRPLRKSDLVARLGGDEFAILLDDIPDKDHAIAAVKRLQAQLKTPFSLTGSSQKTPVQKTALKDPTVKSTTVKRTTVKRATIKRAPVKTDKTDATEHNRGSAAPTKNDQSDLSENAIFIGTSMGITFSSLGYRHPEAALKDADTAMYHAKRQAQQAAKKMLDDQLQDQLDNQLPHKVEKTARQSFSSPILIQEESLNDHHFAIFDAAMQGRAQARLTLEDELRQALRNDQFHLHYQPIFDLTSPPSSTQVLSEQFPSALVGFEGLLRWQHPTRGTLEAEDFIAIAEEIGIVRQLNTKIIDTACRSAKAWQQRDHLAYRQPKPAQAESTQTKPSLSLHINLSRLQLSYPGLIDLWKTHLEKYQLTPNHFQLEIAEALLISQNPSITSVLQQLKAMGFRLCIDDFGRGHSSLSRLHQLDIDTLKIDRTFIQDLSKSDTEANSLGRDIIKTIVALGESTHVAVIAEGIETARQLEAAMTLGCRLGQGFWLSEALPADAVEQVLACF